MKKQRFLISIVYILFVSTTLSYSQEKLSDFPVFKGPYLGQKPPGKTPEVFAPELMKHFKTMFTSAFSPDGNEFYFSSDYFDGEGDVVWMRRIDNTWTKPEPVSFNSRFCEYDMAISPDGYRIFFRSYRPLHGGDLPEENSPIWYAHRTKNGWSEAKLISYDDTPLIAGYPSLSNNGTLYFPFRGGVYNDRFDIYFSRFINGGFSAPVNLGQSVNTPNHEGDLCVAPDESFLIVTCWFHPDNNGDSDLYITFRETDGSWSALKNMGPAVNHEGRDGCPMLTPDGKYLLFLRSNPPEKTRNYYWIDSKIIDTLKPDNTK